MPQISIFGSPFFGPGREGLPRSPTSSQRRHGRDAFSSLASFGHRERGWRSWSLPATSMMASGATTAIGLFFNRLDRVGWTGAGISDRAGQRAITTPNSSSPPLDHHPETDPPVRQPQAVHGPASTGSRWRARPEFADRRGQTDNLALEYPEPRRRPLINIGVLHTSLTGRPPHANYAPVRRRPDVARL